MNLLDVLKNQLTGGNTLGAISSLLGENAGATTAGIGAALPTLLGSVIQNGSTATGANSLLNLIKDGGHDGGILDNLGSMLGGGSATSGLMSAGSGILSTLLGSKLGGITNLIGQISGLKGGSVTSLLSLVAPVLMGGIGKQVASQGLGASGLMNFLSSQSDFVKAALPAGASSLLGFAGNMGNIGGNVADAKRQIEENIPATSGFNFLPWLIGAAVLLGGIYGWQTCNTPKAEVPKVEKAVEATKEVAQEAATAVSNIFKVALPTGVNFAVPKGSLEEQIVMFIQGTDTISKAKWFDFDRLLFATGKATLEAKSQEQLSNMAAIMKAFPKVKIKIGGYTDNVGKAASNLKLSGDRAKNVMGELVKLGVEANRMEAEGYGDKNPVASNDTEEGRAKNRRISVSVRAK